MAEKWLPETTFARVQGRAGYWIESTPTSHLGVLPDLLSAEPIYQTLSARTS
jgi:hypothetical protein